MGRKQTKEHCISFAGWTVPSHARGTWGQAWAPSGGDHRPPGTLAVPQLCGDDEAATAAWWWWWGPWRGRDHAAIGSSSRGAHPPGTALRTLHRLTGHKAGKWQSWTGTQAVGLTSPTTTLHHLSQKRWLALLRVCLFFKMWQLCVWHPAPRSVHTSYAPDTHRLGEETFSDKPPLPLFPSGVPQRTHSPFPVPSAC